MASGYELKDQSWFYTGLTPVLSKVIGLSLVIGHKVIGHWALRVGQTVWRSEPWSACRGGISFWLSCFMNIISRLFKSICSLSSKQCWAVSASGGMPTDHLQYFTVHLHHRLMHIWMFFFYLDLVNFNLIGWLLQEQAQVHLETKSTSYHVRYTSVFEETIRIGQTWIFCFISWIM